MENRLSETEVGRRLSWARQDVEAGDRMAILFALRICALEAAPIPKWLANSYVQAVNAVFEDGAKSWDAAFGEPWPGLQERTVKNHIRDMLRVDRAIRCRPINCPIDQHLFEVVGKRLDLSASVVRDLWCNIENPFARSAAKRRATTQLNRNSRKRGSKHAR